MHVFSASMPPGDLSTYPGWMLQIPEARRQIEGDLRELLAPARTYGVNVPLVAREGNPVAEILKQAESMAADLIVLSTHGRSGFDRLALGSVTEKVLRKASCPVLVVPAPEQAPSAALQPPAAWARIVCAVDFSECATRATEFAVSLAKQSGATVVLAHVIEGRQDAHAPEGSPLAALRRTQRDSARDDLRAAAAHAEALTPGVAIEQAITFGVPHAELLRLAAEQRAELIVMGVRGRGAIDMTIFGSTTNQVVRRAPCAVLTVRT